ncbi:MAG: hypothetical protein EBX57_09870, partial [Betaproteobacteria bacterium]|nr:hypothetical protein [Betaproteobacteria bacterium]
NRSLSQLRGILWLSVHGSIFSKVGASSKPGAVQIFVLIGSTALKRSRAAASRSGSEQKMPVQTTPSVLAHNGQCISSLIAGVAK